MNMPAPEVKYGLCPLCTQRPTDTTVYYDEVLSSRTASARLGRLRTVYSSNALTSHGNLRLCSPCAARYEDSIASRRLGRRLLNWGVALLFGGALLFLILFANTQGSLLELVTALPVFVAIVMLGAAVGLLIAGNRQAQPLVRHLRKRVQP